MAQKYQKRRIAASMIDHKIAALYFDSIIPLHSLDSVPKEVVEKSIFPQFLERFKFDETAYNAVKEAFVEKGSVSPVLTDSDSFNEKIRIVSSMILTQTHEDIVPVSENIWIPDGESEAMEISLVDINLINPSHVEWEQVLEIRRDRDSCKKLRNLKLYLYDNFQGKSKSYIVDKINKNIDDYELAVKKHGLKMIESSLSTVLDSKSLLGTMGVTAASLLAGSPTIASLSAITGTLVEIGKVAIKISSKYLDLKDMKNNHELAYLFSIKEKIDNS